jgi:nucleotide-binding universal stress UspA family protein
MKMLLCTIGSAQREETLRFATAIARALSAEITLLGVVSKKRRFKELEQELVREAQGLTEVGVPAQVRVEAGDAESVVMAEIESITCDLVVLGALGQKRSRRKLVDSVAMHIIEKAQTSVLLVKGNRPGISRVLICASASEYGHLSIWAGAAIACGANAQATVLHVVDPLPTMYAGLEQMEETLAELLQSETEMARELKWAAQVVRAECDISELKLRRGLAADEILVEGREGDYDLIVLGSSLSGRGIVRALMGDLTREIVTRAQRPVLVVRPIG